MKLKRIIKKMAIWSALKSVGKASDYMFHQPKEPKIIENIRRKKYDDI